LWSFFSFFRGRSDQPFFNRSERCFPFPLLSFPSGCEILLTTLKHVWFLTFLPLVSALFRSIFVREMWAAPLPFPASSFAFFFKTLFSSDRCECEFYLASVLSLPAFSVPFPSFAFLLLPREPLKKVSQLHASFVGNFPPFGLVFFAAISSRSLMCR